MRMLRWVPLAAALLLAAPAGAPAGVILSLTTDRPLGSLAVGNSVNFTVQVRRTAGEQLDTLTTKVLFTDGVFTLTPGTALPLASGGVVPDPPNDFVSTTANNAPPGKDFTDGAFLGLLTGDVIDHDGPFFSFRATLKKAGLVTINFDPAATTAGLANGGTVVPTVPPSQTLAVGAQAVGVPEPVSLLLWCGFGVVGAAGFRKRARRP